MVRVNEYSKAYTEVLEVINSLSDEEYSKIPQEEIEFFERNKDENYIFYYDSKKSLHEQTISREAKALIVILFQKYFASEEEKKKIEQKAQENQVIYQEKIKMEYNPDNLFNNEKVVKDEIQKDIHLPVVSQKQSIFQKIIEKIKNFFKR